MKTVTDTGFVATLIADLIHRSTDNEDYATTRRWVAHELGKPAGDRAALVQEALDDIRIAAKYAAGI